MSCCGGGGCGSGSCDVFSLSCDPCFQKLCCNNRRHVCYKPFIPSYERCDEEVKMGKLLGFDYQRRWYCERNVWMCKVYGQCGGKGSSNCCPPPCAPPVPKCCGSPCSIAQCCPAPRLTLCAPDCCAPCCRPMPPCPPRCPPNPCFPKVCCPPPCCPDPCIKPSRRCFIPPPCCPQPCCRKMALVVNPPMCPPRCCPPRCCIPPKCCPSPCCGPPKNCCGPVCPCPAMIVRPLRNNCCPPPPRIPRSNQCPIPCCNPLPPCCVIVKPCQPRCPPSPCCPPPPMCAPLCPQPDPRCCPRPMVISFKCPTSQCPMRSNYDKEPDCCPRPVSWPAPPKIDMCCSSNCPPRERDICFTTVRPMAYFQVGDPFCSTGREWCLCCRPRWNDTPAPKPSTCRCVPPEVPLPCVSCRYNCWVRSIPAKVDTNLGPSLFSSRVQNAGCHIVKEPWPTKPCPDKPSPCPESPEKPCPDQ